ncbi:MAG: acetyl-CoA carboxylase biotin carboxylase subunit [Myxococcales bacterium]|nr:acetyl-CoA carboxylase biotin carboxylase subunit [Myxococcales bacterium]
MERSLGHGPGCRCETELGLGCFGFAGDARFGRGGTRALVHRRAFICGRSSAGAHLRAIIGGPSSAGILYARAGSCGTPRAVFRKVLIANRGEIAVRIVRTLRELGIRTVAVFSDADRAALHVRMADEAIGIGPALVSESYLRIDRILDACRKTGAEAIHPGYGFLSEKAELGRACADAGVVLIGPPVEAIEAMGSKTEARARMVGAGVPVVPGATANSVEDALTNARTLGYPVMVKAAMGGGGKGMRLVVRESDLGAAVERAASEAEKAFGDGTVYLEKAIERPRHVEIQLLGDRHGNVVHLFERDCSIQRRHQKVIEETPCPVATDELVRRMGEVAVRAAEAVGYYSAGTVEFLLAEDGAFYFLEMNTRLQVEHPITEWVTGIDLVREMVRVAAGEALGYTQADVSRRGASIECRIYAEDPERGFMPSPGKIVALRTPQGPFVRDDSGIYQGSEISSHYDPLISKLSVWAPTRELAIQRMRRALGEYVVGGIKNNLAFHERVLRHEAFLAGRYHTGFIELYKSELCKTTSAAEADDEALAVAVAVAAFKKQRSTVLTPSSAGLSPWVAQHRRRR